MDWKYKEGWHRYGRKGRVGSRRMLENNGAILGSLSLGYKWKAEWYNEKGHQLASWHTTKAEAQGQVERELKAAESAKQQ